MVGEDHLQPGLRKALNWYEDVIFIALPGVYQSQHRKIGDSSSNIDLCLLLTPEGKQPCLDKPL